MARLGGRWLMVGERDAHMHADSANVEPRMQTQRLALHAQHSVRKQRDHAQARGAAQAAGAVN